MVAVFFPYYAENTWYRQLIWLRTSPKISDLKGKIFPSNYRKQLLYRGLDALKIASKKEICNTAEVTGEFLGNKIADKIVIQKPVIDENPRNVEEINIPPEKREEILNELRQVL